MVESAGQEVIRQLVSLAINGLVVAAAGFVVLILKRVASKFGLQIDAIQEARVKSAVQDIIVGVEEEVEARAKIEAIANKGYEKLEIAVGRVASAIPGISDAEAETLVKQELPKVGLGASGHQ